MRTDSDRHYTIEEANASRAWVATRIGYARAAVQALVGVDGLSARAERAVESGGDYPGRTAGAALVALHVSLAELERAGVMIRDLHRGLVDFPSTRDGQEICLCWQVDEHEIAFWHSHDAGFAGRQPL